MILHCVITHMHTNLQRLRQTQVPKQVATQPPGVVISNRAEHLQDSQFVDKIANWRQIFLLLSQVYTNKQTQGDQVNHTANEAVQLGYEFDGSWMDSPK